MARACRREMQAAEVRVHLSRVYIRQRNGKQWTRYEVPAALRSEIIAFDKGGKFEPGEYGLKVLRPSQLGGRGKQQGSPHATKRKNHMSTGKRRPKHIVQNVRTGPA